MLHCENRNVLLHILFLFLELRHNFVLHLFCNNLNFLNEEHVLVFFLVHLFDSLLVLFTHAFRRAPLILPAHLLHPPLGGFGGSLRLDNLFFLFLLFFQLHERGEVMGKLVLVAVE